ncbi:pre-mRNA-splicing helicase BRR2 [Gracilaria domingensis]|nr:pre-mRNA-splicing helicase BRR2 [Gracilaria domingensis]
MTDEREIMKQYSYKATSKLVIENEKRKPREQSAGITPLQSSNMPGRMGDKVASSRRPQAVVTRIEKRKDKGSLSEQPEFKEQSVLDVAKDLDLAGNEYTYIPTTRISQRAFEALLAFVMSKLGDQPRELLRSATDEVLVTMKDDKLQDNEKKKLVEDLFGIGMNTDEFTRLNLFCSQINDYKMEDGPAEQGEINSEGVLPILRNIDEEEDDIADEVVEVDAEGISSSVEREDQNFPNQDPRSNDGLEEKSRAPEFNIVNPKEIDAMWLERQLSAFYDGSDTCRVLSDTILSLLQKKINDRTLENELASILDFDKLDFISMLLENRKSIAFCTRLARAKDSEELTRVKEEIISDDYGAKLLKSLSHDDSIGAPDGEKQKESDGGKTKKRKRRKSVAFEDENVGNLKRHSLKPNFPLRKLDIESLKFQRGGRLMTVRDCKLPEGSEHVTNKDYEEWHIPAVRAVPRKSVELRQIRQMPKWAQPAFSNTQKLNRMQSQVYPCAFESDANMLLCAPTGAGKTNVAMLTILRCISNAMPVAEPNVDKIDMKSFKIVYVAPMKALVAEVVQNLSKRLDSLGLEVRELTGDVGMSSKEIEDTQVIVTTPEKWDIITRKGAEKTFLSLVRLLIVDEIHLLHDERGPVIETLVARTLRGVESGTTTTRVVGLSATLPNFKDVATFLRVDRTKGLFYFDSTHRPCPLQQCYVGITAKKAFKRFQLMNELTYGKVKMQLQTSNQVIIFVHSRKETGATCRYLIEKAIEEQIVDQFLNPTSASHEIIQSELASVEEKELLHVLEHGLAIHHAGMARSDRQLVEALFEQGHVKVLVSTATLAWGVNLPAHAVIIKGTQVYSPQHGRWIELSSMDVMQMMGRAGRPQFDNFGEGYIITSKADVLYYLSLLNDQLPIESQFISRITDMLNAEVASGAVSSITEGSQWLCYTYLYVRMVKDPTLYGITADESHEDKALERRRAELIHAAAVELHRCGLIVYNEQSGELNGTALGRVASDFYVSHDSMSIYTEQMKSTTTDIDLLHIFSMSNEFRHVQVREEEKLELVRLAERVPIPIKESLDEPTAKVSVLLQSYISKLGLDGLALQIWFARHENWAALFDIALSLYKSVSARQWPSQTPLRQFGRSLGEDVLHRIERKDIPFEKYYDLTVSEVGELLRDSKLGTTVHRLVHSLPRLEIEANVRPLSRSILEIDLNIIPDFRFSRKLHKSGEGFWIVIEDADSEVMLHSELFFLRPAVATEEHSLGFTVKLSSPTPPQYFVRCNSDRWIAPTTIVPLSFQALQLPEKFGAFTELADIRPLSLAKAFSEDESLMVNGEEGRLAYREALSETRQYFEKEFTHFSKLQTQVFDVVFEKHVNAVVASLPGDERDKCGELCVARLFVQNPTATAVWVVCRGETAIRRRYESFVNGLGKYLGLSVRTFLSEGNKEVAFLRSTSGALVITTPERWDMFSRRWRQKRESKIMERIRLLVLDGVHHLSDKRSVGSVVEIIGSRSRYQAAEAMEQGHDPMRIIALSDPIANARDIGHWIGAPPSAVFSFHPKALLNNFRVDVVESTFSKGPRSTRALSLAKPVFTSIQKYVGVNMRPTIVFVASRRMARSLALELVELTALGGDSHRFGNLISVPNTMLEQIKTISLRRALSHGVAFLHGGLDQKEQASVQQLFAEKRCSVLVATSALCWTLSKFNAHLVIVAGTSCDDDGAYVTSRAEYSSSDLLRMICCARASAHDTIPRRAIIITEPPLREQYELYALEPFPAESQLPRFLADHFNAEIEAGVIDTKQYAVDYLTWTFFYRRLPKNPNYYGMNGVSHVEISNHLSELVETTLTDLESSKCITTETEEEIPEVERSQQRLSTQNIGRVAAHFYVRHATVELFASSVSGKTKIGGLLDILSLSSEFSEIPVRLGDEEILRGLAAKTPVKLEDANPASFSSPHVKAHLLLQAQLIREPLPKEIANDQKRIVVTGVRLLRAMVDVIAIEGWLQPALAAIELGRMLVQGIWDQGFPLMQLPHIDRGIAFSLGEEYDVVDIFGFLEMNDEDRSQVLKSLTSRQVLELSEACKVIPNMNDYVIESLSTAADEDGTTMTRMVVTISRNEEDEESSDSQAQNVVPTISAPLYPENREEGWWVIVGNPKTNTLLSLRHVALKRRAKVKLRFDSPPAGLHTLQLSLLSDSYVDCDQEDTFEVRIPKSNDENGGDYNPPMG